jgi:hypothetical protein
MSCNIISKCGKDSLMIQNPFNVPINELGDTGLIILLFVLGIYIYIRRIVASLSLSVGFLTRFSNGSYRHEYFSQVTHAELLFFFSFSFMNKSESCCF